MTTFFKHWHKYGGKLVPKQEIDDMLDRNPNHIPTRLKVGEKVWVGVGSDDLETEFLMAIVVDCKVSELKGPMYDLAFALLASEYFAVISDFTELALTEDNRLVGGPGPSGIFNTEEYENYMNAQRATTTPREGLTPTKTEYHLKIVKPNGEVIEKGTHS